MGQGWERIWPQLEWPLSWVKFISCHQVRPELNQELQEVLWDPGTPGEVRKQKGWGEVFMYRPPQWGAADKGWVSAGLTGLAFFVQ